MDILACFHATQCCLFLANWCEMIFKKCEKRSAHQDFVTMKCMLDQIAHVLQEKYASRWKKGKIQFLDYVLSLTEGFFWTRMEIKSQQSFKYKFELFELFELAPVMRHRNIYLWPLLNKSEMKLLKRWLETMSGLHFNSHFKWKRHTLKQTRHGIRWRMWDG